MSYEKRGKLKSFFDIDKRYDIETVYWSSGTKSEASEGFGKEKIRTSSKDDHNVLLKDFISLLKSKLGIVLALGLKIVSNSFFSFAYYKWEMYQILGLTLAYSIYARTCSFICITVQKSNKVWTVCTVMWSKRGINENHLFTGECSFREELQTF